MLSPENMAVLSLSPFIHIFQASVLRIFSSLVDINIHINHSRTVQKWHRETVPHVRVPGPTTPREKLPVMVTQVLWCRFT